MPRALALALLILGACKFPYPADVLDDGALAADAMTIDAGPPDAPGRTGPLVQNGQAADLVLGQPSFGTNVDRGVTSRSFLPDGIAFASGRLWVADFYRHRALGWSTPTASDQPADVVLGQPNFASSASPGGSATTMFQPAGVVAAGDRVIVLDGYNRALVWSVPPVGAGQAADLVLGQANFSDGLPGNGPAQLKVPIAGWSDGNRLFIRGGFTALRIWSWSTFPTASGTAADLQLLSAGVDASATTFGSGVGMTSDGTRLVVVDTPQNRVLIWNAIPAASGRPADVVLGQPTFTTGGAGTGASAMNAPTAVLIVDGALLVADTANDRVLVFDPIPSASGASATQVLGQTATTFVALDSAPSDRSLNGPTGLALGGHKLFVADQRNRRILRYDLALP